MILPLVSLVFLVSTVTSSSADLNNNECGIKPGPQPTTISPNGSTATPEEYPWNIALYRKYGDSEEPRYICTGNIIHPRVVLASAYCVYDEDSGAEENSTFMVAAGKFDCSWKRRDPQEQRRQVNKIYIPPSYSGMRGWFANDIALLALNESFVLGTTVLPVCIDWKSEIDDALLQSMNGTLVGWVGNENGLRVETLKYYSTEDCRRLISKYYGEEVISSDKFCAVTDNFPIPMGGSGLTYPRNTTAKKQKHYLFGVSNLIVSHYKPSVVAFIDVRKHLAWLNETLLNILN